MPIPVHRAVTPAVFALTLWMAGCTPAYMLLEVISDATDQPIVPGEIGQLPGRNAAEVRLTVDSLILVGTLTGVRTMDSSSYRRVWDPWAERAGIRLRPGDTVHLEKSDALFGDIAGVFRGISEGSVHIARHGKDSETSLRSVRELRHGDTVWTGEDLRRITHLNPPPSLQCLSITTEEGAQVSIPVDRIRSGTYTRSTLPWGLLITVPLDIALVAALTSMPSWGGPP